MPSSEAALSVTLKRRETERYAQDGLWTVGHGSPTEIAALFAEMYGIDAEGKTPFEVILEAERIHKGSDPNAIRSLGKQKSAVDVVKDALDGEVISVETDPPFDPDPPKAKDDDPWADSGAADDNNAGLGKGEDPLITAIKAAGSKTELKVLWSENQEAFKREDIKTAAAARAKEL